MQNVSVLDEKEKYDPSAFRDAVIQGINETEGDLELVSTFYPFQLLKKFICR